MPAKRKAVVGYMATIVWVSAVLYGAMILYGTVMHVLWTSILATAAALAFAAGALIAGPPRFGKSRRSLEERRAMSWRRRRRYAPFSVIRTIGLLFAGGAVACVVFLLEIRNIVLSGLPPDLVASARHYEPAVSTRVYAEGGEEICRFTLEDRVYVRIEDVPPHVRSAFTSAEDDRFYEHHGIDVLAILRAAKANHDSGDTRQGGSTISQQVVKNVILKDGSKSMIRKLREAFLVVELERMLSKDEILEIYLNHIFLGHGAYGIRAAADIYFGKRVEDLSIAEAAMLAGLPKAPSNASPYARFDRAKERQRYVLRRMREEGRITDGEYRTALEEDVVLIIQRDPLNRTAAPYFCEHVRRELQRMYGHEAVFKKGLTVRTTVDLRMQRAAESAVRYGLVDLERRLGFNGPSGHDDGFTGACADPIDDVPDGVIDIGSAVVADGNVSVCVKGVSIPLHPDDVARVRKWEKSSKTLLRTGDTFQVRLVTEDRRYAMLAKRTGGEGHPEALQAALVSIDPTTGRLKALVGGYDFGENQYNNATQARRQTGSSVKPYVYLAALMHGFGATDAVHDRPVCYATASGTWCPKNYLGPHTRRQYLGRVPLRTALAKSLNSVSVQLADKVGISEVIRVMRRLGIDSPLERVLPLAIGSEELTLWEHAYGYATIAAGGREMPRHPGSDSSGVFFLRVEDADGTVLYEAPPLPETFAVTSDAAYQLTWLMKGVVEFGTGRRVQELGRPAAGKTGTTNDFRDAWFMGFTADLVTGVWVGRLTPEPIAKEATGGSVALPIWMAYMKAAHPDTPPREFPVPDDVVLMKRGSDIVPYRRGRTP